MLTNKVWYVRLASREEGGGAGGEERRGVGVFGAVFTAGTLAVAQTALTSACLCVCVLFRESAWDWMTRGEALNT